MLNQMKEKFNGCNSVEYRQGEAENLPIKSDTVDYAMANMYLTHVEEPLVAIKEMVRILKLNGKVVKKVRDASSQSAFFLVKNTVNGIVDIVDTSFILHQLSSDAYL